MRFAKIQTVDNYHHKQTYSSWPIVLYPSCSNPVYKLTNHVCSDHFLVRLYFGDLTSGGNFETVFKHQYFKNSFNDSLTSHKISTHSEQTFVLFANPSKLSSLLFTLFLFTSLLLIERYHIFGSEITSRAIIIQGGLHSGDMKFSQ